MTLDLNVEDIVLREIGFVIDTNSSIPRLIPPVYAAWMWQVAQEGVLTKELWESIADECGFSFNIPKDSSF